MNTVSLCGITPLILGNHLGSGISVITFAQGGQCRVKKGPIQQKGFIFYQLLQGNL